MAPSSSLLSGLVVPDGWAYAWKRRTIRNWDWDEQQKALAANGWRPVPSERHDGAMMPKGYDGPIEVNGWVLMERLAND